MVFLLCYQTKKQIEELGTNIEPSEKEKVESLITRLETAMQGDDTNSMKSLIEEIQQAMMGIGQKAYVQAATNSNQDSKTIETDFSVVS